MPSSAPPKFQRQIIVSGETVDVPPAFHNDTQIPIQISRLVLHIHKNPALLDLYTNHSNFVCVVSNGTAVLGLGDIGGFFPDNDPSTEGICSLELLKEIRKRMLAEGYHVVNVDSLIMIERPKMKPYIPQMRKNIADILDIDASDVNVKATCYEKMGPVGEGKAVIAQVVVLLQED